MDWLSLLDNPKCILGYFESAPSLSDFELVEVRYDYNGPTLYLRGNLAEHAAKPSPRWDAGSNSTQITFQLILEKFEMRGVATGIRGDLSFQPDPSGVSFFFESAEGFVIRGTANFVSCSGVTGYIDERRLTTGCSGCV